MNILQGGHVSGFRNVHDRDNYDPNATILYHVHSDNADCTRAIQVNDNKVINKNFLTPMLEI